MEQCYTEPCFTKYIQKEYIGKKFKPCFTKYIERYTKKKIQTLVYKIYTEENKEEKFKSYLVYSLLLSLP